MKQFIPAVIVVVGIVAGGVGGQILKSGASAPASDAAHGEEKAEEPNGSKDEGGHGEKDKGGHAEKAEKPAKKDGHGGDDHGAAEGDVVYYKFTREFVVPIMEEGRVKSLVILNINLEADAEVSQSLFNMEPKLRDNIMTTLVGLSNDGVTFDNLTDVGTYESLRSVVLMNLESVVASGIRNVLIVDIAKQDL